MINKIKNKFSFDISKVNFKEAKTNMKIILENFCLHSFFQHFIFSLIPLFQIYYFENTPLKFGNRLDSFSDSVNLSLIIYGFSQFSLRLITCFLDILNQNLFSNLSNLFSNRKYYEMGENFRKITIFSVLIIIVFYYPIIIVLRKIFISFVYSNEIVLLYNEIYLFQRISFITIILYSLSEPIVNLLYCFGEKRLLTINYILKFVLNISLCKFFSLKPYYVLVGCAISNLVTELISVILLFVMMKIKNPYPQSWVRITLKDFFIFDAINLIDFKMILNHLFLNLWGVFMIYFYFFINVWSYDDFIKNLLEDPFKYANLFKNLEILILLNYCKELFFCSVNFIQRTTLHDLMKNFNSRNSIKTDETNLTPLTHSSNHLNKSFIDDDFDNQVNKLNIECLKLMKSKIIRSLVLSFFFFLVYLIFYITNFFYFFLGRIKFLLHFVSYLNGVVCSLVIELFIMNKFFENHDIFRNFIFSFLCSGFPIFIVLNYFFDSLTLILMSFEIGKIYFVYKSLNFLKNLDVRVKRVEKLLNINNTHE